MKRKHYLVDGQLVKVYQKWSELRPRQKTGSWNKQENLFNGSQITRSALLPALKKVISFIRFMNQSSKKASGFLTEKYSVYYAHAGEGRYVMFVSVPIPSVLRRDSSSTGQARSVKDGGRLQFFFIFPLDKH